MLVHHLLSWTGGDEQVRRLLAVSDGMNATDLAAPAFAIAAGASASLAGRRNAGRPGALSGVLRRWVEIAAWGVAISFVLDGHLDAIGVLEILAVVGAALSVGVALGDHRPHPIGWAVLAAGMAGAALPSIEATTGDGGIAEALFAGRFPAVSYLALGAAGAAVADFLGPREGRVRLGAVAGAAAAGTLVLHLLGVTVWPPDRTPGGLPLIVPGVVATVAVWTVATALRGRVADVLARAGRRTLEVFIAHYAIRILLNAGGWTGELQGPGWAVAAVALAVAVVVAAGLPWQHPRRRRVDGGLVGEPTGKPGTTVGLVPSQR
jgi:hypothetical protein